ncbi:hypothetical protein EON66_04010 [archaeon]|nr:MAG: hypothetical protein EON66_04010 [archaeon]
MTLSEDGSARRREEGAASSMSAVGLRPPSAASTLATVDATTQDLTFDTATWQREQLEELRAQASRASMRS